MKAGGRTIKPMARADSFMLTEMSTMATGKMTKPMVSVFTAIWMVQDMKVIGKKINNTARDWKPGQMVQVTREITWKAKSTAPADSHGQTAAHTLESSKKTISRELVTLIIFTLY